MECRGCWARKEAAILSTYLESLPDGVHAYTGVLRVEADITVNDHRAIRRKFLEGFTKLARTRNDNINIYAVSELNESLRCHYHLALTSTTEVTQHAVKTLWDKACKGWPTIVFLEEMRSRKACSKYAFNDLLSPGYVRLFKKKSLRLTWGHTGTRGSGFYPRLKEHYWRQYIEKNKDKS